MNLSDINQNTIIYDTENWHENPDDINPDNGKFRLFGWYEYSTDEYKVTSDLNIVQETLNKAKVIVSINGKEYDNKLLERLKISFEYKIQLDLRQILMPKEDGGKGRGAIIVFDGKNMKDTIDGYSMEKIGRWLKLNTQKQEDFDYSVLKKEVKDWTPEEKAYIYKYLKQDLQTTKEIYEFLENYFAGMRKYLCEKDINKKEYIRATTAVYAYKVMCHKAGFAEDYADGSKTKRIKGGFVKMPVKEEWK